MHERFPTAVDCYLLQARNGLPPHPMDEPVATVIVHSEKDVEKAKKDFQVQYPGGWVVERPIDMH